MRKKQILLGCIIFVIIAAVMVMCLPDKGKTLRQTPQLNEQELTDIEKDSDKTDSDKQTMDSNQTDNAVQPSGAVRDIQESDSETEVMGVDDSEISDNKESNQEEPNREEVKQEEVEQEQSSEVPIELPFVSAE